MRPLCLENQQLNSVGKIQGLHMKRDNFFLIILISSVVIVLLIGFFLLLYEGFEFFKGDYQNAVNGSGSFIYQTGDYALGIAALLVAGLGLFTPLVLSLWAQTSDNLFNVIVSMKTLGLDENIFNRHIRSVKTELQGLQKGAKQARFWLLITLSLSSFLLLLTSFFHILFQSTYGNVIMAYKSLPLLLLLVIALTVVSTMMLIGRFIIVHQPTIGRINIQLDIIKDMINDKTDTIELPRETSRFVNKHKVLVSVGTLLCLIVFGQLLSSLTAKNPELYPSPFRIIDEFIGLLSNAHFYIDVATSITRVYIGVFLSVFLAIMTGLVTGRFQKTTSGITTILHIFRPTPVVALVPLAITWLGIGWESKISLVVWGAFFPTWVATHLAVMKVEIKLLWVAETFGARRIRKLFTVVLPASLPTIIPGIRTSIAIGFIALVAAEMTGTSIGIGYRITEAYQNVQTPIMISYILFLAVLAALTDGLFILLTNLTVPWYKKLGRNNVF